LVFFEKAPTKVKGKFAKGNDPERYTDENGLAKQSGSVVPITWPWQFFSLIYNCSTSIRCEMEPLKRLESIVAPK
jgi:hypothetical protein